MLISNVNLIRNFFVGIADQDLKIRYLNVRFPVLHVTMDSLVAVSLKSIKY